MVVNGDARQSFQEAMELKPLPPRDSTRRYIGVRAAWMPGQDLPLNETHSGQGKVLKHIPVAAFGGHVYSQAALAACRVVEDEEETVRCINASEPKLGLHTIHGFFTMSGLPDRPFIYEVDLISNRQSFTAVQVRARQPTTASAVLDHFPMSDAEKPLTEVVFTAMVSFKMPEPDSLGVSAQEESVQQRFADILSQRRPQDWPPNPPIDIDPLVALFGSHINETLPMAEMRKVDMREFNASRPLHERRELILYKLANPLPVRNNNGSRNGFGENAHALVHAFVVDRNGLCWVANHVGFSSIDKVASLSYTFVVHTNVEEMVMQASDEDWWVQEVCFPRAAAGRGIVASKIWSPRGVHVASEYQDGISRATPGTTLDKSKL